jgi:hypothetical protein
MKHSHPLSSFSIKLALMLAVFCSMQSYADETIVKHGEDPTTGLKSWLWDNGGFYLELTQRLPDQTRGYFESRGFDNASTEIAGTSCIFQTMIKNSGTDSSVVITADLDEWQVISGNTIKPMLLREYWQKLWLDRNQSESAKIAFEWSLLPTKVKYEINDYNWGMSSYGLVPGSRFDLLFFWYQDGKKFNGRINDVICPDDIHPEPAAQ